MVPESYITEWRSRAPWQSNEQIEQDLIISRTLVALFSDDFLRENLAFRGGTALHKLYLQPAPRYSEDIDLVQIKEGPIKPILQQIGQVVNFFEEDRVVKPKANNNTLLYRFYSEYSPDIRLRLKIEINCREHFNLLGWRSYFFEVNSPWFSGNCNITTYCIEELLGTKLRALYQRKKGRDLFDIFYASQHAELDYSQMAHCYNEYMKFVVGKPPSFKNFISNMLEKQNSSAFKGDMNGLLRPDQEYNQELAFQWLFDDLAYKIYPDQN